MEPLRIYTFGGLRILLGDLPVTGFETRKAEALLVYLAVSRRGFQREVLGDLLWDERSQHQTLSNLRVALASLRKRVGTYLDITRDTIAINPDTLVWTDVASFEEQLLKARTIGETRGEKSSLSADLAGELKRAVELYRGEFLEGFYLRESNGFEDWLVQERERLHSLAINSWQDLVDYHIEAGSYQLGMDYATQLLKLNRSNELAHRQIMQLYALSGRRSEAFMQYEVCRQILQEEFGVEPGPETELLLEKIRSGEVGLPIAADSQPAANTIVPAANPYKGLRAFQEADAEDFFGREAITGRLLDRVCEEGANSRFLALVGPSGSGKSSLAKAGLIPALRRGALPGSEKWVILEMVPGSHPFEELEVRLLRIATNPTINLMEQLRRDERGLLRAARLALGSDQSELLLVIDQFEEVFTLVEDKVEVNRFLQCLYVAVTDKRSPIRLVVTLRADFFDRPLMYQEFSKLLQDRTELVVPLTVEELERTIRVPAERSGIVVDPGLVATIIADMVDRTGALPLLQFALTELFERRENHKLTLNLYQTIGGVRGVLERQAETTYAKLSPTGKAAARQVFLRLVILGEGMNAYGLPVHNARRRVLRSELEAVAFGLHQPSSGYSSEEEISGTIEEVIEAFGEARLLSFDWNPLANSPTVEITHEALLTEWPRLSAWLEEDRSDVRIQRTLDSAAVEWGKAGRDPSFLLQGSRLSYFESWASETNLALTGDELTYLTASLAEREAQRTANEARQRREASLERRSRNFLRTLVVVLLLAVVASVALTGLARRAQTLATSRELAVMGVNSLENDPELGILLSLHAMHTANTREAEDALHRAVQASRVRMVLPGHEEGARTVEFSPDGKTIATASGAGEVRVWDLSTGQELFSLPGRVARYSPDGTRLATGSEDGKVTLWDFSTKNPLWIVNEHQKQIIDLKFSPNGKLFVSTSQDNTFIVWDSYAGEKLFSSSASVSGTDTLPNVSFSPDGTLLLAADFAGDFSAELAGTMRVWRVGQSWPLIKEYRSNVMIFTFSAGGRWLALPGGRLLEGIYLRSVSGMFREKIALAVPMRIKPLTVPAAHESVISDFAFNSEETIMATGSQDSTAKIWHLTGDGAVLLVTLSGHDDSIIDIDLNPDGTQLATASRDGTVRIWDITSSGASEWFTLAAHSDMVYSFALTPDGKYLATSSLDGTAKVWELASGKELLTITGHGSPLFGIDMSTDGRLLATAGYDNTVKIWNLDLSNTATAADLLHTISGHTNAPVVGNLFPGLTSVAFSPDYTKLATGGVAGKAMIWDVKSGLKLLSVQADPDGSGITNLALSPDGKYLATTSDDISGNSFAKIWDATSGDEISTFSGQGTGRIFGLAFSQDGKRVATGGEAGTLKIWDLKTGAEQLDLIGHTSAIISIDFTSDGKYLVTSSLDGTARVWEALSGKTLRVYTSPGGPFFDVAFSPDDKNIVVSGAGFVSGLILDRDELVRLAYSRLTRWFTVDECRQYLHQEKCPPR